MCNVHRVHVHERDDLCSRVEMSAASIEKYEAQTTGLEEQYKFFQTMRGYVVDLTDCCNEKVGAPLPIACVSVSCHTLNL